MSDPQVEETVTPVFDSRIMDQPALQMLFALLGTWHCHPFSSLDRPLAHHRKGQFAMKLKCIGPVSVSKGLIGIGFSTGETDGSVRQVKPLTMPLIYHVWPVQKFLALWRGFQGIVTDFHLAFRVGFHLATQMTDEFLGAEANAQKRSIFSQWYGKPVNFTSDEFLRIIGAHRTAKHDGTSMFVKRVRKWVSQGWAAYIKFKPAGLQHLAKSTWCGGFLLRND